MGNIIYWNDIGVRSHPNLSIIEKKLDGSIYFKHDLLNPGLIIKEWVSKTNYQKNRVSPDLPILKRESKYKLSLKAKTLPEKSNVYVKIFFFDRYEDKIGEETIKEKVGTFIYPKEAYTYKIQLINIGIVELYFEYFKIEEIEDKIVENNNVKSITVSNILNINHNSNTLNILFIEPKISLQDTPREEYLNGFDNLICINSDYKDAKLFFDKDSFHLITEKIRSYQALGYEKFNFIGYDRVSNIAASLYALEISSAVAYVTNIFAKQGYYERISKYDEMKRIDFANIDKHKDNIIIYANAVYGFDIDLVSNFVDKSHLLTQCPIFKHR